MYRYFFLLSVQTVSYPLNLVSYSNTVPFRPISLILPASESSLRGPSSRLPVRIEYLSIHLANHCIDELGALALFDILSLHNQPLQHRVLKYQYGGPCNMMWLSSSLLAVGTTRGKIVVFSLNMEVCPQEYRTNIVAALT